MKKPLWLTSIQPARSVIGLSDSRRLPRLGKLRLGIKVGEGEKEHPKETDYFVSPPEVVAVYGEQPKRIKVMFALDDREVVFPQALMRYGKSRGCLCRGNGERAWEMTAEGMVEIPCPCPYLGKECGLVACLMVLLPEVTMAGVYQIDTGSAANVRRVNNSLVYAAGLMAAYRGRPTFSMIPFWLKREAVKMQSFEMQAATTHYLLHMELDADFLKELTKGKVLLPAPPDTTDYTLITSQEAMEDAEVVVDPPDQPKGADQVKKAEDQEELQHLEDEYQELLHVCQQRINEAATTLKATRTDAAYVFSKIVEQSEKKESLKERVDFLKGRIRVRDEEKSWGDLFKKKEAKATQ